MKLYQLFYSLFAGVLLLTIGASFFLPMEGIFLRIIGFYWLVALVHPTILIRRKLKSFPFFLMIVPLLLWAWYYGILVLGRLPLSQPSSFIQGIGVILFGYFFLGVFYLPILIVLELFCFTGALLWSALNRASHGRRRTALTTLLVLNGIVGLGIVLTMIVTDSYMLKT